MSYLDKGTGHSLWCGACRRVPNVPPSCEGAGEGIGEEGSVAAEEACGCTDLESSGQRLQQRRRAGSLSSHSSLSSVGQQQDHNSSNCSTPRQRPKRRGARRRAHVAASAAAVTANAAAVVRASRDAQQGAGTGESFRDLWSQLDQQLDELCWRSLVPCDTLEKKLEDT